MRLGASGTSGTRVSFRLAGLGAALFVALLFATPAHAQNVPNAPPPPVPARPDQPYPPALENPEFRRPLVWEGRRFSTLDWIISGSAAGVALATNIVPPVSTHWTGTNGFDEGFRDAFRLGSQNARYTIRDVSDVLLSLEVTWPFFADALIGAWWYHGSADVATQMALIDIETYTITAALQGTSTLFASRERPYGRDCGSSFLPTSTTDCSGNSRYRSFFSGHSALSFMGASLTCVHHLKLDLWGDRTADVATCAIAYGTAAATAMMRVMGDVHYVSDILVGAAVGTVIGIGIPLIHYKKPHRPREGEISLLPFGAGLALGGQF